MFLKSRLPHVLAVWLVSLVLFSDVACARRALNANLLWNNEIVSDLSGGLRTGSTYDSMLRAAIDARTQPLGIWSGGLMHLSVLGLRSGQPSANYIGDFQSVSNIEAPNAARIYSAWYRQRWGKGNTLQLGLIDMNTLFDVTEAAGTLLNASFSLDSTLSGNLPISTYPEPGYGLVFGREQGNVAMRLGVFQGNPTQRTDPTGSGAMSIAEFDYGFSTHTPTQLGLGLWHYRLASPSLEPASLSGGYINVTQALKLGSLSHARAFFELGLCPTVGSTVPQHLSLGIDIKGPFNSRPDDQLSLGVTQAKLLKLKAETDYEATYQFALNTELAIQPDLQLIQHPSGEAGNATVFILRLVWNLG